MFKSIPSCLRRHKKKLFLLGGVVGGIAILNTYLKRKFIEWEAQKTAEIGDQLKRSSHFEGTMTTCDSVYLTTCAPKIRQVVCETIDVNKIVTEVATNPPNKMQLWEELKISVFSQALGEMYAQCLLCILLRVQMSILSGYVFLTRCTNSTATEQQTKYMSRIEDFMRKGISPLLARVKSAVERTLQPVKLQHTVKQQEVEIFISSIQSTIFEGDFNLLQDISSYLMPSSSSVEDDSFLEIISKETKDVIECQDFTRVLHLCIDSGISSLMDQLAECYGILSGKHDQFVNPNEFSVPFAKLIPIMHNVFCQHNPTKQGSLVHNLLQLEPLNDFAANIYEAFSQKGK